MVVIKHCMIKTILNLRSEIMASTAVLFCFLVLHCITALDAQCSNINYTTISDIRRNTAYNATYDLCDNYFIQTGSWYRFKSVAGNNIPEFSPGINSCGTHIPIWMNGTHPTTIGVEVDRIACAPDWWWYVDDECYHQYNIKVINCGSFFLYQLKPPRYCNSAYCTSTKLLIQRNCSSDGTSFPICPDAVPTIPRPQARPKDEDREYVALRCSWNYFYNASYVEFHVRWFRDSNDVSHAFEHTFNGTVAQTNYENLYEYKLHTDRRTGRLVQNPNGYEWNKKAFCKVQGRFHGNREWSMWKSSETIFTGIVVHPRTVYLDECAGNKEVSVSLRPSLPIRKKSFKFEVGYNGKENIGGKICIRGKISNFRCLTELTERHVSYRPLWIRITAVCETIKQLGTTRSNVEVKFHTAVLHPDNNPFWAHYDFLPIKISLGSSNSKLCQSTTDPNIVTFDGRYYNPYQQGTFRLYRNRNSGTEVQTRLNTCCNCGVAIREGYYFKIVELCSSIAAGDLIKIAKTRHTPDMAKNGFYTEEPLEKFTLGKKMIVHLPSGITVTIGRSGFRDDSLDIIISAPEPNYDQKGPDTHSEGLCGNFNGDPNDDFEGRSYWEFFQRHRIQSGSAEDIFAYKGNDTEYQELYDTCLKEHVCICKSGSNTGERYECDKPGVIAECSPLEQNGKFSEDLCRGNRVIVNRDINKRRKRALDSRDDDIDDQDVIPPYNPPIRNYTAPSWPTPSGLTEENVTEICNRRIRYSKGGESCGAVAGVDLDALVNQCISDIKLTDDPSWAVANFGAMNEICKKNVYKNITYYKNSTDGKLSLETTVLDSLCPNDCSDRGNCSNSTCTCFEDYTSADCSISLKDSPILYGIRKSGICDVRRRPCRNVGIYAFPLLDSENLTCHVQEFKVIESVWTPDNSISLYPGLMMDINEVKCSLPESPVNIGDYGNEGITAAGLKIAVSNNRINASKVSAVFITYDSVCQDCNNTIKGCQFKTDACFISAHCFAQNQSHPNDWCQQCLPQISTKSWEKRRDNQRPKFTTSTVLYAFLGKELRVQLSAIDPENRTIRYTFVKNNTLGASLTERGFFTCTKNTNDSTIVIFNVTDECGAYSVLHASVVIKECPCQNSGDCHPDYRYLDGAGNFTCSCPAGYTGTLCELDVNECASKPCLNGNCNNEQPGFSCSCYVGYTGDLCQTEINECAPDPCFLGVPCTDLIASFSCGPCPGGYSGNGVNCTRMDGKVDECVKKPEVCHSNAKCMYNNGSYVCQCTDGYTGDGKNNCTDVDECVQTPDICHQNANCSNTEGNYSCQCLKGYTGDGKLNCSDTDECTSSPNMCIQNAQCSNTVGSYVCQCAVGYSGDGYSNCTDINECQQSPSACHSLAKCTDTEGSFFCQCDSGFVGDGIVNCTDVDECSQSPSVCHQYAKCTNTVGYFSCQCNQGFLGDGIQNCAENRPPQFTIPSAVYAILNNDFKIQIMAVDPENQDMTFTLLSNGTLSTARISKQLLTISNVKENGTVYVQVQDEMGAKNILILQVNAFECPCVYNGKCYQNKTIVYPIQPSDYLCECEDPYTGDRCEIRPNPCFELPCYPGLKCSTAQNSEGFTCEDCPTLFQGDGKQCELKPSEEKSSVVSEMTLTDQKWDDQLKTKTSKMYKNLASQLTVEIRKVYKDHAEFSYVIVKGFRRGSIIVEIELIFTKEVEDPLKPLMEIKEIGKLGKMRVKMKTMQDDSNEDKILGLDKTIFFVIVGAAVVFLLMISVAIYLRIKRHRTHGEAKFKTRILNTSDKKSQGIAFQPTDQGSGEEIDLKVFDNEAIRLEDEIKIEP